MKSSIIVFTFMLSLSPGEAQTSMDGAFVVEVSTSSQAKSAREHSEWIARVFDKEGRFRYSLSKDISFDLQFPSIAIANNGASIVIQPFDGLVEIFSPEGNLIRSFQSFGRMPPNHEQVIKCSAVDDRFALLISHPEKNHAELVFMTLEGNELWRRVLAGTNAAEVFVSAEQEYIAAGSYTVDASMTTIFDEAGSKVASHERAFRYADITGNGMVALSDRNSVRLFQLPGENPLFEWKSKTKEEIVTNLRLLPQGVLCSVEIVQIDEGTPTYINPMLLLFNGEGILKGESRLNATATSPASLVVNERSATLESSAQKLTLHFADELR